MKHPHLVCFRFGTNPNVVPAPERMRVGGEASHQESFPDTSPAPVTNTGFDRGYCESTKSTPQWALEAFTTVDLGEPSRLRALHGKDEKEI